MSVRLNLTGLNLQPISLRRSEMPHAMCALDDLLQESRYRKTTATSDNEEELRMQRADFQMGDDDSCVTSACTTESSLADLDDDVDDSDHLSVNCIKAFDHDDLINNETDEDSNNGNSKQTKSNVDVDNNNALALSSPPSPYFRDDSTIDQAPHHKRPHSDSLSPPHAAAYYYYQGGSWTCSYYYPPTSSTDTTTTHATHTTHTTHTTHSNNKNARGTGFHSPDRPFKHPRYDPQYDSSSTIHQPHFPNNNYYGSASVSTPTETSTTSKNHASFQQQDDQGIPFKDLEGLSNPNQHALLSRSQEKQQVQSQKPPFAPTTQLNRPVESPTSDSGTGAFFPQSPTTDTGSVATPQPLIEPKEEQQRSSKKPAKARASPPSKSKKQASKKGNLDPPSAGDDNQKQKSSLKPIHHQKWQRQYNDLLQFKRQYGHCLVPIAYEAVPTLSHWVKRQRNQYKLKLAGDTTALTDERQRILDDAGFVWDSHQALWTARLADCRAFRNKYGHCSIPARYYANPVLAAWAKCQRRQFRIHQKGGKSPLTAERINDLNQLDFVWDPLGPRP